MGTRVIYKQITDSGVGGEELFEGHRGCYYTGGSIARLNGVSIAGVLCDDFVIKSYVVPMRTFFSVHIRLFPPFASQVANIAK